MLRRCNGFAVLCAGREEIQSSMGVRSPSGTGVSSGTGGIPLHRSIEYYSIIDEVIIFIG